MLIILLITALSSIVSLGVRLLTEAFLNNLNFLSSALPEFTSKTPAAFVSGRASAFRVSLIEFLGVTY